VRAIDVLIDRDAIVDGRAADSPWKYYDLGHGYCSFEFFEQCPHRMACARCDFYIPKASSSAHLLEAKAHLLRLKQEISLSQDEISAIYDGVEAYDTLLKQLSNKPTPSQTLIGEAEVRSGWKPLNRVKKNEAQNR
jgi:hypothetical protein